MLFSTTITQRKKYEEYENIYFSPIPRQDQ